MRKLRFDIADYWQSILAAVLITSALGSLYLFKLNTLTTGLNKSEQSLLQSVLSNQNRIIDLVRDSIWLPHEVWLYVIQVLPLKGDIAVYALRGFSVMIAMIAIFCVYILLKHWFSYRISIIGTLLFATSSWMLHVGRFASHDVLYLLPLVVFAAWSQLQTGQKRGFSLVIAVTAGTLCLYVPGLVWIIAPAVFWQRKFLRSKLRNCSPFVAITSLSFVTMLALPLLITIIWPSSGNTLDVIRHIAGIPQTLPSITEFGKSLVGIVNNLFVNGSGDPTLYAGKAPLVSFFSTVMLIIGAYDLIRNNLKLDRTKILILFLVVGTLLSALNKSIPITILLPAGYILVANGIRYMLQDWLRVFPRNPVARGIGISMLSLAVILTITYNLQTYFIAWPHTPATKSSFIYKV